MPGCYATDPEGTPTTKNDGLPGLPYAAYLAAVFSFNSIPKPGGSVKGNALSTMLSGGWMNSGRHGASPYENSSLWKLAIVAQTCAAATLPTGLAGPCGAVSSPAPSAMAAIFFNSCIPPQYFTSGITTS